VDVGDTDADMGVSKFSLMDDDCVTNSGIDSTKAALAVAMASELGRWEPHVDLTIADDFVQLSGEGLSRCEADCPNTTAILGLQEPGIAEVVEQNLFDPISFREELKVSFDRHSSFLTDLAMNKPEAVPPAHQLSLVGGPTELGLGACGAHYIFQVNAPDGEPLTESEASAIENALCYYGNGRCGGNPFLAFTQTPTGCTNGETCVAIDPTDGDNGSTNTTTDGAVVTYPANRVYNPSYSLLGRSCLTTTGLLGELITRCDRYPRTCGWLFCIPKSDVGVLQGVTANAFGLCPAGTQVGTYCKLSYATGAYYSGDRWCQSYGGDLRCVLK